jgi:hypothetical protein
MIAIFMEVEEAPSVLRDSLSADLNHLSRMKSARTTHQTEGRGLPQSLTKAAIEATNARKPMDIKL